MDDAVAPWVAEAAKLPLAFAQVREDALIDYVVADEVGAGARITMVASGGCTAAMLASQMTRAGRLHIVDPNPAQLALTRLKLRLLETADTPGRLAVLGHAPMPAPERAARMASGLAALGLPADALGPPGLVAEIGPDHVGRYERCFDHLRRAFGDLGGELAELLRLSDPAEQSRRVAPDTPLGRRLDEAYDEVLSLPNLVGLFGAAATQNRVEPFARHFARRTRHVLATLPAVKNPYLWQMLAGRYPPGVEAPWFAAPPPGPSLTVTWHAGPMDDALRAEPGAFDVVHLSNILDWLTPDQAGATLQLAAAALRPGGRVVIRQLNSTLDIPALGQSFEWEEDGATINAHDRSFFYRALHLGRRR